MTVVEDMHLTISVGGSKCALALVSNGAQIVARSERIGWTLLGITGIASFLEMLTREAAMLLTGADVSPDRIVRVGIAWPGPQVNGRFAATFVPGCRDPQPVADILREYFTSTFGARFTSVPILVVLDAIARAAGEATGQGSIVGRETQSYGLLVNWATGIAGSVVLRQRAFTRYPDMGENYGQFGRFLFLNTFTSSWVWKVTQDGTVPQHAEHEVRWSVQSAGPYLVRRFARAWFEAGTASPCTGCPITQSLHHYASEDARRDVVHEMEILRWISLDSSENPQGLASQFVTEVALETAGALAALLEVFKLEPINRVVLAGGVGENFGRSPALAEDRFLSQVSDALKRPSVSVVRAALGIDAEFLGLASNLFSVSNEY